MTAAQLITYLQRFDPTTPVLVLDGDGYRPVSTPEAAEAVLDGDGDWHAEDEGAVQGGGGGVRSAGWQADRFAVINP